MIYVGSCSAALHRNLENLHTKVLGSWRYIVVPALCLTPGWLVNHLSDIFTPRSRERYKGKLSLLYQQARLAWAWAGLLLEAYSLYEIQGAYTNYGLVQFLIVGFYGRCCYLDPKRCVE